MKAIYRDDREPHQLDIGEWCSHSAVIYACCPGDLLANLASHEVTIPRRGVLHVSPSILCNGGKGQRFHGFIENGVWLGEDRQPIDWLPGRLGHTERCGHMRGDSCDCGASYPPDVLHERALKASSQWSKREYRRTGTVPTRPEWLAWIERWKTKHSADNGSEGVSK